MACCQGGQSGTGPANLPSHHCGAAVNRIRPATAAAMASRRRRWRPRWARVSRPGAHHTQWCDQDTGEMSRAANALSTSARQSWSAARARRMPRYATTTTTAESVSQAASPTGVRGSSPARARTATRTGWPLWPGRRSGRSGRRPRSSSAPSRARPARTRRRWRRRRKAGHSCGPVVASEQEEQHERRGSQLHRGGQADQHAARPARFNGQAVQGHQGHQHDVDLAVGQLAAQRLEQQRRRQQPGRRPHQ